LTTTYGFRQRPGSSAWPPIAKHKLCDVESASQGLIVSNGGRDPGKKCLAIVGCVENYWTQSLAGFARNSAGSIPCPALVMPGSPGLHEECFDAIIGPVREFFDHEQRECKISNRKTTCLIKLDHLWAKNLKTNFT
jgi:hypothetical protein